MAECEIEIEGVGIYRLPNMWQQSRIRVIQGPNRHIAPLAFGLGMTVKQFKKLPIDKQQEVRAAYNRLTDPDGGRERRSTTEQRPRIPRPYERLSEARMIELGRELLTIKAKLPRGHFMPWVEEKSGITYSAAQRFMKMAKDAE